MELGMDGDSLVFRLPNAVAPDTRDVRMQQRALFEDRPAWERALEMRVRARAKLVPDRVKGVLANVATRARLAALGKRAGAGARSGGADTGALLRVAGAGRARGAVLTGGAGRAADKATFGCARRLFFK